MRAAILCLVLLIGACATGPTGGYAPSTDTNPETGAHGGGNVN